MVAEEDPCGAHPPVPGSHLAAGGSLRGGGRQGTRRGSQVQGCAKDTRDVKALARARENVMFI